MRSKTGLPGGEQGRAGMERELRGAKHRLQVSGLDAEPAGERRRQLGGERPALGPRDPRPVVAEEVARKALALGLISFDIALHAHRLAERLEDLAIQVADVLVAHPGDLEILAQLAESVRDLALVLGRGPQLEDALLERRSLGVVAEHHVELTHHELEHVQLLLQDREHVGLDRVLGRVVVDEDVPLLPQPMDAADPLLDLHRIPGQIEVDHPPAELEITPLAAGVGGHEHPHLVPEPLDRPFPLAIGHAAVERLDRPPRRRRAPRPDSGAWHETG